MPRKLLIVEQNDDARETLKARFDVAGYFAWAVPTLDAAREALGQGWPDAVLMNAHLPEPGAAELARLIADRSGGARTPVILLDPGPDDMLPGGVADAVVRLPVPDVLLLARVRNVLRMRDLEEELAMRASTCRDLGMAESARGFSGPAQIFLVPQRVEDGVALADALSYEVRARISVLPREQLLTRLDGRGKPDIIVIEADPEDPARELQILPDLRCRRETRHAAILMRFPQGAEAQAALALDLGASDVTLGPDGPAMLAAMMRSHLERAERVRSLQMQVAAGLRLAVLDPLTGLYNRRYALSHVTKMADRSAEKARPLALMVLDIDHFKRVNDTHGHQNGDRVLKAVARALSDSLRAGDLVARIGGEEFLIALPDSSVDEAQRAAQRLRSRIAALEILLDDRTRVTVTLSIGLTVSLPQRVQHIHDAPGIPTGACRKRPAENQAVDLIAEADRALLEAKAHGRNRVMVGAMAA